MAERFVLPYQTVIDGNGVPLNGALLYFYISGTSTPLITYSDAGLTTPNPDPVQANAAGVFPNIFLLPTNYKVVLTDASNNQIWTADPVSGLAGGDVVGPSTSTVGDVVLFNNLTGTLLSDSGVGLPFVPPTGIADPSTGLGGAAASGSVVPRLDESWIQTGNFHYLLSKDTTIYPGHIQIGGTWAAADIAKVRIAYGSTTLDFSYTVQVSDTNQIIANALQALMLANATLQAAGDFVQAVGAAGGGAFGYDVNFLYAQFPITLSNQSTTGSGTVTVTQPSNILDGPLGLYVGRSVSGRAPQANDYLGGFMAYGQYSSAAGTAVYNRIDNFIGTPGSTSYYEFQTAHAGAPSVSMGMGDGLYLADAAGVPPTGIFLGRGWMNVPQSGGYSVNNGGTLTNNGSGQIQLTALGTNALDLATSDSSQDIFFSPNGTTRAFVSGAGIGLANGGVIFPNANSTTAVKITNANQTANVVVVDTTNNRVGVNKTPGAFDLDVSGAANIGGALSLTSITVNGGFASLLSFKATVNFNSGNTDTAISVALPSPGFNRYRIFGIFISGASHDISTATCGVFTATGGGGTAIVAGSTAITVTATAENTNNNMQSLTVVNQNTNAWNLGALQFRVQTAEGTAATATVTIVIEPMS